MRQRRTIFDVLEQSRKTRELIEGPSSLFKVMEQSRKTRELIEGPSSLFKVMEQSRKTRELIEGPSSLFKVMEQSRKTRELIEGPSSLFKVMEQSRKTRELIEGPSSLFKVMEQSRKTRELIEGPSSLFKVMEQNRKLLESINGRSSVASIVGMNEPLSTIVTRPGFASMISAVAMPRPAWAGVLDGLRDGIDGDLYDEASAEFDIAAELSRGSSAEISWIERLPLTVQLALLLVVLQVLDKMSEFMGDVTGQDVPPAYRSGVQVLFALAAAVLALVDAKAAEFRDEGGDLMEDLD